jgi:hypothetical protein
MGFNKTFVDYDKTLLALKSDDLDCFYEKTDAFVFEDSKSLKVYELFVEGKTSKEIIEIINEKDKYG